MVSTKLLDELAMCHEEAERDKLCVDVLQTHSLTAAAVGEPGHRLTATK